MDVASIFQTILIVAMIILSIFMLITLVVTIMGPKFTDRLVCVAAINTEINLLVILLAVYFSQSYMVDIALVYGVIGFLAIVVLAKLFMKDYLKRNKKTFEDQMKVVSGNDGDN